MSCARLRQILPQWVVTGSHAPKVNSLDRQIWISVPLNCIQLARITQIRRCAVRRQTRSQLAKGGPTATSQAKQTHRPARLGRLRAARRPRSRQPNIRRGTNPGSPLAAHRSGAPMPLRPFRQTPPAGPPACQRPHCGWPARVLARPLPNWLDRRCEGRASHNGTNGRHMFQDAIQPCDRAGAARLKADGTGALMR